VFKDQVDTIGVDAWLMRVNTDGCYEDGVDCTISSTELEVIDRAEVVLYPNPVGSVFSIESTRMISSLDVYTIGGQFISSTIDVNAMSTVIESSHLDVGVYQVVIYHSDGDVAKHRFVKH
jgi:hypothetical protein